jgi:hypothetical protein
MTDREAKLREEGWTRRSVASEPRLSEIVALYKEIGFEVRLEPLHREDPGDECRVCLDEDPERFKVIYTRPEKNPSHGHT